MKKWIGVFACLAVGCAVAQEDKSASKERWMIKYKNDEWQIAFTVIATTQEEAIKQMNIRMKGVEVCKKAKSRSQCWENWMKQQTHVLN